MKREMEAYIVLLDLVSRGWATFKDIEHLVGWNVWKQSEAIRIMAHINHKILDLSEVWDEDIPRINAFMFNRFGKCTTYVCKEIFGCDEAEQPSPRQIVEYAQKVAAYENWDKVLKVFQEEAFQGRTEEDEE